MEQDIFQNLMFIGLKRMVQIYEELYYYNLRYNPSKSKLMCHNGNDNNTINLKLCGEHVHIVQQV